MSRRALVMPPRVRATSQPLVAAAEARGLPVITPDQAVPGHCHYYGGPGVADTLALDLALLEPPDSWLPSLPEELTARRITATTLGGTRLTAPAFVKPPSAKHLPPRVYRDQADLTAAAAGLPPETPLLLSEVTAFAAEYRLYLLDGEIHTGSRYLTWGNLDPARLAGDPETPRVLDFAKALLAGHADTLPSAVVLDIGLTGPPADPRRRPAVVEANLAWFTEPYQSDPDRALEVILRAAGPRAELRGRDARFVRG
ncbi:ATP-grasp domain-containing protein [Crossiella sp. CA-258035]|uniref:ATP-grasp domain-containing protein n=1 Tax=Crossiella sp. CA-258035 TaxID=2981138 RepID=UPI0024BCD4BF|nr:ATP-grasp domain-containing protein [Crossiella sp. CA-258035]WHT18255.1 ATP-grasp domain-containing protein [Crossiella sp. CA-258035]